MRRGAKMMLMRDRNQVNNNSGQMNNGMGMTMGGYGNMEANQGGQMRNEMTMGGYGMESRFRDRRGREHYDNGRYAPQSNMEMEARGQRRYQDGRFAPRNDMGFEGPWSGGERTYDIDINRYEYEPEGDYRSKMRGGGSSGRRGAPGMTMGGYGGMEMDGMEMTDRRNPVGFAAHFDSPGSSDASYQRMNEMDHRSGSKMDHGGARSTQMPQFDERMAKEWVSKMENEDGTRGPHWTMDQVKKVMEQRGIREEPAKFYAALNMMYSDYCEVAKKLNVNNMDFFAEMAKSFLKDRDAGAPDKLAAYYEYIVKG